ncbi:chromosome segregation ATPase [Kitasatospora paracochleata]|uniref:Chromosome segregation ATPase n=1 Tax=Kitasatospora paracochleata TaxID=58354 RepID=A0ABT1IZG0_9ACTN|nr:chromosome segregation ATPase [Kitasatospora paracochleata]
MRVAGGGGGGWGGWGRRRDGARADAKAARDAAQEAFYELDSAQRDALLAVETVKSAGDPASARQVVADFQDLSARIDQVTVAYLTALDAQDLDRAELDPNAAWQAKQQLEQSRRELDAKRTELTTFVQRLQPVLERAEAQLVRVTPAVERARQALLGATTALEQARSAGLRADELAARLAELAPELTRLNQGVAQHGVPATLQRAEDVSRRAELIRSEAEQLPERAKEIDHRVASLRTRIQALETRSGTVEPALSELRRRFSAACWQDLQQVPAQSAEAVRTAQVRLADAVRARDEQRWADATAAIGTVRTLLETAEGSVTAVNERLRQLNEVQHDPHREIERARFALRDAQRLAMSGRQTPDPRHAGPLDAAVGRLDRAVAGLEEAGRHPDYWHFLTELAAVRETAAEVVAMIRGTH